MRHNERFAHLQRPKQIAGLQATLRRKRRRFDFAVQPNEGFAIWIHNEKNMSYTTYCQDVDRDVIAS